MSMPTEGAERRADLLDRIQETGDRHDAAELERKATEDDRGIAKEMRLVRQAAEELRAAAEETRQLNAEMRQQFFAFLDDLRRAANPS